jgi:hypothetical protein
MSRCVNQHQFPHCHVATVYSTLYPEYYPVAPRIYPLKHRFQQDAFLLASILLTLNHTYLLQTKTSTNNLYNMSDLPKYSRSGFDTTETDSLVKSDRRGSLDGPAPSYPPTAGSSSNGLANITYSFIPQWPVPGKRTNVLGVLGRDTEVSSHFPSSRHLY